MGGGLCSDFIRDSLVWQETQLLDGAAKTEKQEKTIKNIKTEQMIMFFFIAVFYPFIMELQHGIFVQNTYHHTPVRKDQ